MSRLPPPSARRPARRAVLALLAQAPLALALPSVLRAAPGDIAAALARVPPGGTLELPGGDWGTLALRGPDGPAVIRSADPADPARFSRMELRDVAGLRLEGLELKYDWAQGDLIRLRPFALDDCRDVVLSGLRIRGDVAGTGAPADRGFPTGIGLSVRGCRDLVLEGCEITAFHRGFAMRDSEGVSVVGNDLHGIRMDGMNFAMVRRVRIVGNHVHDFARSLRSKDHSDMIQFWTNKTDRPSVDVVIRDNLLNSGHGAFTQSIFMRNEEVDRGRAGDGMFYRDVLIEGNVIVNAHRHGITLGETAGAVIRRNTLVHNPLSPGKDPTRDLWLPRISVAEASRDIAIVGNIAASIPAPRRGWQVEGNLTVQPHARLAPGFYGLVFAGMPRGDPTDPASYAPRPGGPADRPGLGAPRLGPG